MADVIAGVESVAPREHCGADPDLEIILSITGCEFPLVRYNMDKPRVGFNFEGLYLLFLPAVYKLHDGMFKIVLDTNEDFHYALEGIVALAVSGASVLNVDEVIGDENSIAYFGTHNLSMERMPKIDVTYNNEEDSKTILNW